MKVKVELQAYLEQYSPNEHATFDLELPAGATVSDVVRKLQVPEDLASIVIVSNEATTTEHALREGDHVTLIPPLAGG